MLNELYQLSNIMEKQGILCGEADNHRDIHKIGKFDCLYIRLKSDGMPHSCILQEKSLTSKYWVHSKGNHNRFPCIKIKSPLLSAEVFHKFDEELWKMADLKGKREILNGLDYDAANEDSRDIQITPWTLEQLEPVMNSSDTRLEALRRLVRRFPGEDNAAFYRAFRKQLKEKIYGLNEREVDFWKKLLIGDVDRKTGKVKVECACYFDIWELDHVVCAVKDEKTELALRRCLLSQRLKDKSGGDGRMGVSALSGTSVKIIKDKYPNPNLPILGPTYLYSNNTSAIPCLVRYNIKSIEGFPSGEKQVEKMCDALGFLTDEARWNKTWRAFPAVSGKGSMLLLVWLEDDIACDMKLAAAVGDDGGTIVYERVCEEVLQLLRARIEVKSDSPVHMQLFEVVDKGRRQICYSEILTVRQLHDGISRWREAANDHVNIYYSVNYKDKKNVHYFKLFPPGPGAIVKLMKSHYRTGYGNGVGRTIDSHTSRLTVQEIYHLFFSEVFKTVQETKFLEYCLKQTLSHASDLLLDAGGFHVTRQVQPFSQELMQMVCTAASLLGIILYKMGIRKADIMENSMFLLGKYMRLADYLHKNYCIVERNKETLETHTKPVPARLIGNTMLRRAVQNPAQAYACLNSRLELYIGWADTHDEISQNVRILKMMKEASEKIAQSGELLFPEHPKDSDVAQLYLGYNAGLPL
ncbi:hypothetical protein NXH76_03880 [Blautia schinkii]|nr:hypothetical protein [Blautia schinkii]